MRIEVEVFGHIDEDVIVIVDYYSLRLFITYEII
jgi:hypothetical protein